MECENLSQVMFHTRQSRLLPGLVTALVRSSGTSPAENLDLVVVKMGHIQAHIKRQLPPVRSEITQLAGLGPCIEDLGIQGPS
jgi:hypothetical protein